MLRAHADADADAVVWVLSRFDLEAGPKDHVAVLPAQPSPSAATTTANRLSCRPQLPSLLGRTKTARSARCSGL